MLPGLGLPQTLSDTHVCTCTAVAVSRWGLDWGWLCFCSLYFHIKDMSYWWSLTHIVLQQHNRFGRVFIKQTCRERERERVHRRVHTATHPLFECLSVRLSVTLFIPTVSYSHWSLYCLSFPKINLFLFLSPFFLSTAVSFKDILFIILFLHFPLIFSPLNSLTLTRTPSFLSYSEWTFRSMLSELCLSWAQSKAEARQGSRGRASCSLCLPRLCLSVSALLL